MKKSAKLYYIWFSLSLRGQISATDGGQVRNFGQFRPNAGLFNLGLFTWVGCRFFILYLTLYMLIVKNYSVYASVIYSAERIIFKEIYIRPKNYNTVQEGLFINRFQRVNCEQHIFELRKTFDFQTIFKCFRWKLIFCFNYMIRYSYQTLV